MIDLYRAALRMLVILELVLLPLAASAASAQVPQQGQQNSPAPTALDTLPTESSSNESRSISGPLLERPVSRTEYLLGPADVVNLSIFGFRSHSYTLSVNPEGSLVIPTIGVLQVAGMNLNEAESAVARQVRRYYQDVDVRLSLAAVRSFKVFLVGDVPNPGVRQANAAMRVSEVIPAVTRDSIARRNVTVRRSNGRILEVDLARFLYLGDLRHNPVLLDGDIIQVPLVDRTINVVGQVARPGRYELRPGETLADMLHLANVGGPFRANAADTLRLLRFTNDPQGEVIALSTADAMGEFGQRLVMKPFDALYVPSLSQFRRARTATIEGEVVRPGTYPMEPDVTTVSDLVEMAGGFTTEASLLGAVLRRQPPQRLRDPDEQLQNIPPELLSEDERRILQVTSRADDRNVVLDFRDIFIAGEKALNVPLKDGDRLHIPEIRNEITVLGAVVQPGIVTYYPGQTVDYFVQLTGGYTDRADRGDVVVLKAKLQNRLHRSDVRTLEPGDQIIVPFKEPRTFMDHVRSAQSVMNTISGVVVAILGFQRLWDALN